ncbi:DNA-directed RNA polymerase III subunit RPC4 [Trypanosoma melophagium]|uniref:DNA-directed RNA polymerase III subunit RPC4 n=1 Tax=Trypanosoma melophagium TaxID=715481 RepID=UPI00351A8DF5|nr:DNA-directed RNA polymerase III subunit RPC4 [Trypanosoma melophagium]
MPPKLPNLKYKPRRVVRAKEEDDATHEADLSLVQIERLRLQQEQTAEAAANKNSNNNRDGHRTASTTAAIGTTTTAGEGGPIRRPARSQSGPLAASRAAAFLAAEAERFPANTMSRILEAEADNPNMTVYHPTPLDSTLPARLKVSAGEEEHVRGDDRRVETTAQDDGIMFLKEYEEELRRTREANMRFENEVLNPSANKISVETDVGRHDEGELVWLQLPRFQANPPFLMTQLPSGKIGEVKVYRSGRMVMEICGVHYDVAVEGYNAGDDGACNVVSAVAPPQQPDERSSCYQLGLLTKKMICTPSITVDN